MIDQRQRTYRPRRASRTGGGEAPGGGDVGILGANTAQQIELADERTRVLCEMVGAIDARALGEHVGHLHLDELRSVEEALMHVLGLE